MDLLGLARGSEPGLGLECEMVEHPVPGREEDPGAGAGEPGGRANRDDFSRDLIEELAPGEGVPGQAEVAADRRRSALGPARPSPDHLTPSLLVDPGRATRHLQDIATFDWVGRDPA